MEMHGADVAAVRAVGRRFLESSERLHRHRVELTSLLATAAWTGPDADASRAEWERVSVPAISRTGVFMESLGTTLLDHAAEQERASAISGPRRHGFARSPRSTPEGVTAGVADALGRAVDEAVGRVGDVVDDVLTSVADLVDGRSTASTLGPGATSAPVDPVDLTGLRPERFTAPTDGRGSVLGAMTGLADEGRIGRDEIEIRALDNGRYVVVLPGVTDLSDGFDEFAEQVREDGLFGVAGGGREAYETWADNDEPTVRKMRYAYEAAIRDDTTENEYSTAVIAAMHRAGVPAGADVMIVGHSFGAYTAVDLAIEPTFNTAAGADAGYRVNVTHVVAAGAETDWRFDELPAATSTLVVNNRWDAVYQAENLLHRNASPTATGHVEAEFWGGRAGYGHDEHNYLDWIERVDDAEVTEWLADAGRRYTTGGERVSVQVPDPHAP